MSEEDKFISFLSTDGPTKAEGIAFMSKLKTAANAMDLVRSATPKLKNLALGGGLVAGSSYMLYKKNKQTGSSNSQKYWTKAEEESNNAMEDKKLEGKTPSYIQSLRNISTKSSKNIADVFAEHPVKGALTSALLLGYPVGSTVNWAKNIFFRK